jgi:hypothetical protein
VPVIVTELPTCPAAGDKFVIDGVGITLKAALLLAYPPTVTMMLPVDAPFGTGVTIEVALQTVGAADVPLNVTVLAPCVVPKFVPVIVTEAPTGPDVGDTLLMTGAGDKTVNPTPLLACPPTLTTILPVVALLGTGTAIEVLLQLEGLALTPLNVTVLEAWLAPKLAPVIVTEVPGRLEVGETLVMLGGGARFSATICITQVTEAERDAVAL